MWKMKNDELRLVAYLRGGAARMGVFISTLVLLAMPTVSYAHDTFPQSCEPVVMAYAVLRDRNDANGVAELFAEGATFKLREDKFVGLVAIRERIAAGEGGPNFLHMMSSIHISESSPGKASGISYAAIYTAPPGPTPSSEFKLAAMGEYQDEFVETPMGCRIKSREFVITYQP